MPPAIDQSVLVGAIVGAMASSAMAIIGYLSKEKLNTIEDKIDNIEEKVEEEKESRHEEHRLTIKWLTRITEQIEQVDEDEVIPDEVSYKYNVGKEED